MDTPKGLGGVKPRTFQRMTIFIAAFTLSITSLFALFTFTPEKHIHRISNAVGLPLESEPAPKCGGLADSTGIWAKSQLRYKDLPDDKFTIAIQTYRRPKELNDTLNGLFAEPIPSLAEVVIVWNDLETVPPTDFENQHGVHVRYRKSRVNSLNEKLWPDPAYRTQAIFLQDDDIYYKPRDLEFVFQTWRKFGRHRLTGGFTRCAVQTPDGTWKYTLCKKDDENDFYNMILSGLAFTHISVMDYYSSQAELTTKIRAYVDQHFNCEDIAMNFLTSALTGEAPLCVKGKEPYVSFVPKQGISTKPGHIEARSQCINDFIDMFQCMPLVNETSHIGYGVILA